MLRGRAVRASCLLTEVGPASAIVALHNKVSITLDFLNICFTLICGSLDEYLNSLKVPSSRTHPRPTLWS